jgi:hypothetical protein
VGNIFWKQGNCASGAVMIDETPDVCSIEVYLRYLDYIGRLYAMREEYIRFWEKIPIGVDLVHVPEDVAV